MSPLLALAVAAVIPLAPGGSVRGSLAGGESAIYSIDVPSGSAACIVVRQEGVDVGVTVRPQGSDLPKHGLDFVAGLDGDEVAYPQILEVNAAWTVTVQATLPKAARGGYTVTFDLLSVDDHVRAVTAAWQQHHHASDTSWLGDGASHRQAQVEYLAAADAARAAGDLALAAEATYQCAREHDNLGDTPGALDLQLRALDLFRQAGRRDRESRALNRLGDLSRKLGDVSGSERYFEQALPIARETNDAAAVADILNNSGLLMLATGRFEDALQQLQAAIPVAEALDDASIETALLANSAEAYRSLGIADKAIAAFQRALVVVPRVGSPRRTARTLYQLADLYYEIGERANADKTIRASLAEYTKADDPTQQAAALRLWARMAHERGDDAEALDAISRAQTALHRAREPGGEALALAAWSEIQLDRGETDDAIAKAEEAWRLVRTTAEPQIERSVLYTRALALRKADRPDEAIESIADAVRSVETTRSALARPELRRSYLAADRSYFDLYIDLLQQRGLASTAFEVGERGRARTLLEALAVSDAKIVKGVDSGLLARERTVQAQLNAKERYRSRLAQAGGDKSPRAMAAGREVDQLLDEWNDVRAQIRTASPAFWALQVPQPIDVDRVQRTLLDDDTTLVEYHLGQWVSHAWVVDRRAIHGYQLGSTKTIEDVARRYHQELSRGIDDLSAAEREKLDRDVAALGRQLAGLVWKPIDAAVRGRRLLVVADGVLQYVPFAALSGSNGAPLLTRYEIAYAPSASVLDVIRRDNRPRSPTAGIAVFADPVFSKSDPRFAHARDTSAPSATRAADGEVYGRLRFSRREADAIASVSPGAFEALDFDAAKQTFLARDLRAFRILHFATHGSLNTEHPELSGLVFSLVDHNGKSIDGFLRLHEIYNLELNADLVVLSACQTALGADIRGEGLVGLTRGFMYAGAARVVASVWNVDDRASALLMSRFYSEMLTKHLAPAAALREAQLSLLRELRWANPHYWAAFGLQGAWK